MSRQACLGKRSAERILTFEAVPSRKAPSGAERSRPRSGRNSTPRHRWRGDASVRSPPPPDVARRHRGGLDLLARTRTSSRPPDAASQALGVRAVARSRVQREPRRVRVPPDRDQGSAVRSRRVDPLAPAGAAGSLARGSSQGSRAGRPRRMMPVRGGRSDRRNRAHQPASARRSIARPSTGSRNVSASAWSISRDARASTSGEA